MGRYQPAAGGSANSGAVLRHTKPPVKISALEHLPLYDLYNYYDPVPVDEESSSSDDAAGSNYRGPIGSNSGRKLEKEARWMRHGKIYPWAPGYEEAHRRDRSRKRLSLVVEQLLPESAAEIGVDVPANIARANAHRQSRKRRKTEDKKFLLPHLAESLSPPMTTLELAHVLAVPQSYLDIVTNSAMRHSLGDDKMERGLQRTTGDLIEGERGLFQALGRLRDILRIREQDVPENYQAVLKNGAQEVHGDASESNGHDEGAVINGTAPIPPSTTDLIPPLPHVSDTDNLWRVTQEHLQSQPPPIITFTATLPGTAAPVQPLTPIPTTGTASQSQPQSKPILTPMHRLFTCPDGITFNAIPPTPPKSSSNSASSATTSRHIRYNIDLPSQQRAVDDALERISELLADCNEYRERLEEARHRTADVARARKRVWSIIRSRAMRELDKIEGKQQ